MNEPLNYADHGAKYDPVPTAETRAKHREWKKQQELRNIADAAIEQALSPLAKCERNIKRLLDNRNECLMMVDNRRNDYASSKQILERAESELMSARLQLREIADTVHDQAK